MDRSRCSSLIRKLLTFAIAASIAGCGTFGRDAARPKLSQSPERGQQKLSRAQEADVQIALGRVAEAQGGIEEAEAAYRAALKRDKSRGDAHLHLANVLTLRGEHRQAQEEYQKAIEANPGNPDVFCDQGYSAYLQHRWSDAERSLKQSLAIQPDHRRAHNNLALVLARSNRAEEALAEFRKAGNSLADAHLNLALSFSLDQRWDAAREECRLARADRPPTSTAAARLIELDRLIAMQDRGDLKSPATLDKDTVAASHRVPAAVAPSSVRLPAPKPTQSRPPRISRLIPFKKHRDDASTRTDR